MKKFFSLSISYALLLHLSISTSTIPVQERIKRLKKQLRVEIEESSRKQRAPDSFAVSYSDSGDDTDFVMYPLRASMEGTYKHKRLEQEIRVDNVSHKIRPIKKKMKKTTTVKRHTHKSRNELRKELKAQKTSKGGLYMINPLDIFYRRDLGVFNDESSRKWVQCQDLITPYLTGIKKGPTPPKRLGAHDSVPKKLFEMLSLNTEHFTKDDVFTVIYQISKLQIRLFQWDVMPIRVLMNILTKGKLHTFKHVKYGIKDLFARWRLTFTNTTSLLEATQIIRPPCVETSRYSGSTKSNKVSKFKDWTSKGTTCNADDWTCEERK